MLEKTKVEAPKAEATEGEEGSKAEATDAPAADCMHLKQKQPMLQQQRQHLKQTNQSIIISKYP